MEMVLRRGALVLASLALLAGIPVLASARPAPPPVWSSSVVIPTLTPGATTTVVYSATTADTLVLTVALKQLPPSLQLVRTGSTGNRLAGKSPTWTLLFASGAESTKRLLWRVRVASSARVGSRLCLALRQGARGAGGGAPDVVPRRVCATVARA
jgi:hypothetical protein